MKFDFDNVIERRGGDSTKWNKYRDQDTIPMWVADMDFSSPPPVLEALHRRVEHGVFGYGHRPSAELVDTVLRWLQDSYDWQVEADWLVWLPGVVCGLNVSCRAFAEPGDASLTATPVYYHLFKAPPNLGVESVNVPLQQTNGRWTLDLPALAAAVTPRTRIFMLCNPHNPVGHIYSEEELRALADFCQRHELLICSDEIHCQLVLDKTKKHTPIAALDPAIADRTITFLAPSKTYNMPGLGCAFAVISNSQLRQRFEQAKLGIVPNINVLGYTATLAAYRDGGAWLDALLDYLRGNLALLNQAVAAMPGAGISPVDATYLAWLDFRGSGLDDPGDFFEHAGVGLSDGRQFGQPGFVRLNFACPRVTLERAVDRMQRALKRRAA